MIKITRAEIELSKGLNQAAAMRREAARRQGEAKALCVECRGPDGYHVSECSLCGSPPSESQNRLEIRA